MKHIQNVKGMNLSISLLCLIFVAGLALTSTAGAAPIVYPAKGQSQQQQSKDKGECSQWAIQQTGVDPAQLAEESSSGEVYQRHHNALGGAARGSLLGLVGGAIAGDAGKGAAIGAGIGALGGAMRGRQDLDAQHQAYDNAHAEQKAKLQTYDRAYSACLTGRGYTVQ
jgi:uncharacterized protein YcfJ